MKFFENFFEIVLTIFLKIFLQGFCCPFRSHASALFANALAIAFRNGEDETNSAFLREGRKTRTIIEISLFSKFQRIPAQKDLEKFQGPKFAALLCTNTRPRQGVCAKIRLGDFCIFAKTHSVFLRECRIFALFAKTYDIYNGNV